MSFIVSKILTREEDFEQEQGGTTGTKGGVRQTRREKNSTSEEVKEEG